MTGAGVLISHTKKNVSYYCWVCVQKCMAEMAETHTRMRGFNTLECLCCLRSSPVQCLPSAAQCTMTDAWIKYKMEFNPSC
jgi:hypothetical protein